MNTNQVAAALAAGLPPHRQRLEARLLAGIVSEWPAWLAAQDRVVVGSDPDGLLCRFLCARLKAEREAINTLQIDLGTFSRRLAVATSPEESRRHILDFSARLGSDARALREDERAFDRWFGADAMQDRARHRLGLAERRMALLLERLGAVAARALQAAGPTETDARWRGIGLEATTHGCLAHEGNVRIHSAAFACLASAIRALPAAARKSCLSGNSLRLIYRLGIDPAQSVWLQCEALELLNCLSPREFANAARQRLDSPGAGDDLFVRRRLVLQLAAPDVDREALAGLPASILNDPSAYVRQGLAEILHALPADEVAVTLPALLTVDPEATVRAAAALALPRLTGESSAMASGWLLQALERESSPFVSRALFLVAERLAEKEPPTAAWRPALTRQLAMRHRGDPDLRVRRWAAQTTLRLSVRGDPGLASLANRLDAAARSCPPGNWVRLGSLPELADTARVGRVLAMLAADDHPLALERRRNGWRLHRGHRFGFRLWRWLHEMRHPSPDKRQAFRHTIGRIFRGQLHAPSGILAELAETRVPGEPLHMGSESGHRPYLPLLDQILSALDEDPADTPVLVFTAEGVTAIHPPATLAARLLARLRLTLGFARLARMRNFDENSQAAPTEYLDAIGALGVRVDFRPYDGDAPVADPAVTRFFPASALFAIPGGDLWARFENYFFSVFENTLFELALFTAGALTFFIARHLWQNRAIRRARKGLPLVVGGWGTRGKSGTERIKAALFNALGYSVVSKTTGCEAMFLHGHVFDDLREMFLFRPYDKATIWEQHNVVQIARRLEAEVFLWECMALTPAFVQLLQRRWMRDDIATLTNTFPDHEDLQGPAGIDIPQVMTNFIPENGRLLTSEEQMRPILQTAADTLGTRLTGVGWLESGLLPPDVLARFPYQEHPDNIALVVALAAELGIPADFALKEMADRVVPDLGVLKTYPTARVAGRRLTFSNGMSANERFGCLGNWKRLEFDRISRQAQPGTFISTVVNNRADRVARSRVFAGILVEDIAADLHFLIGSNLAGLQGYIRESWQPHAATLTLWPPGQADDPIGVLDGFARRLRLPLCAAEVGDFVSAMLSGQGVAGADRIAGLWPEPDKLAAALAGSGCPRIKETLAQLEAERKRLETLQALRDRIAAGSDRAALDEAMRKALWQWFSEKIVVVEDFHATGDQIIALIASRTPPGFENRVMGIQNIKGTGLDFVYRWQAWDQCHRATTDLLADDTAKAQRGLAALASFHEYGLLCEDRMQESLAVAARSPTLQLERQQASLAVIRKNFDEAMNAIRASSQTRAAVGRFERFLNQIEGFFDAGDAVRRRRTADRIYDDLACGRISHARAAIELQALNKRQKGGWLHADLRAWIAALSALVSRRQ